MRRQFETAYLVGFLWFTFASLGFLAGVVVVGVWPPVWMPAAIGMVPMYFIAKDVWKAVR